MSEGVVYLKVILMRSDASDAPPDQSFASFFAIQQAYSFWSSALLNTVEISCSNGDQKTGVDTLQPQARHRRIKMTIMYLPIDQWSPRFDSTFFSIKIESAQRFEKAPVVKDGIGGKTHCPAVYFDVVVFCEHQRKLLLDDTQTSTGYMSKSKTFTRHQ